MTTTAAGDAAVARLNKATEAFEKIITGASNQVVDVPGYGNQPTLAARVDERLDETTATAAAEANRSRDEADRATIQANAAANSVTQAIAEYNKAKTQADRAQSEADRAAQITGLETVADAIGMAALPLPDVWAPLSDSLRMITGYGRDVLVGSDVVARMVNFSRSTTKTYRWKDGSLKTAAVNEPAFELEGLLPDGQSTNLVPWSEDTARWSKNNSPTLERMGGVYTKVTPSGPASGIYLGGFSLTPGRTYTFSFWGYADAAASVRIGFGNEPSGAALVSSLTTTPTRYTKTFVATLSSDALTAYGGYGVNTPFYVGGFDVEELPFASSYIPTNGAAVTRAADLLSLPQAGNFQDSDFTVAIEVKRNTTIPHSVYPKLLQFGPDLWVVASSERVSAKISADNEYCSVIKPAPGSYETIVLRQKGGEMSLLVTGVAINKVSRTGRKSTLSPVIGLGSTGSGFDALFGNIRNLRVWHRALSDEQMRAIK